MFHTDIPGKGLRHEYGLGTGVNNLEKFKLNVFLSNVNLALSVRQVFMAAKMSHTSASLLKNL